MPDIYCRFCGEPWDIYELHDVTGENFEKISFLHAAKQFAAMGCGAFDSHSQECNSAIVDPDAARNSSVMQDLSPYPDEWIL